MNIQLQLVYQHHPSKIPKMNLKSFNGCNHGNTYISVYFKMIRYTLKNISGTQSMVSYNLYIIVVIMKGIARVIDKSSSEH